MASLVTRFSRLYACRNVVSTARRGFADKMLADPMEHATGLEKKELLAMQAGNMDPFNINAVKRNTPGTRESPTPIPSCFDARIVGCICKKKELLAMQTAKINPINFNAVKPTMPGYRVSPMLIPSCFCICEEHSTAITWFWLHKGQPRRCECGNWYKLIEKQPL